MLKAFVERSLRRQEQIAGEPTDFLRDVYTAAPGGFWRFALFIPMSRYRKRLPVEARAVASIAAVHAEDCGPCLQTVVNLASAAGDIRSEELRPLIESWWGKASIAELALAITSTRVFPTVKRVMAMGRPASASPSVTKPCAPSS